MDDIDFRDVIISYEDGEEVEVTVVVGDGKTVFDETFEYDARVFFYFHDEAEFNDAWLANWDGADFKIESYVEWGE